VHLWHTLKVSELINKKNTGAMSGLLYTCHL